MLLVRLDATSIEADSAKDRAAGTYKGGFGFHPLTAFCSNVGDSLAVMLRSGNAGSLTAADHLLVIDAALGQVPAQWRRDVLVTVDGAGASHAVINHLTSLNTALTHGRRGRRVEYSIGWPVDERTQAGIDQLRATDWAVGLTADGRPDPQAGVADLTGILRHSVAGDQLAGWPPDQRVIVRRVPRPAGEQPRLGEHPDWRYGAFTTNTATGQTQWLDAQTQIPKPSTQAHIEDKMKELKACGAENLPSTDWGRNSAWLQLTALATSLNGWLRHLALHGDLAKAEPKGLRYRRPRPTRRPRPPTDPADPTRLEMGGRPRHRLGTAPSTPPRLTTDPRHPYQPTDPGRIVEPTPTRAPSGPQPRPPTRCRPRKHPHQDDHEAGHRHE